MMTGPADEVCPGCGDTTGGNRPPYLTQGQGMIVHGVPDTLGNHRRQPAPYFGYEAGYGQKGP